MRSTGTGTGTGTFLLGCRIIEILSRSDGTLHIAIDTINHGTLQVTRNPFVDSHHSLQL